jgi:hypothetical protein
MVATATATVTATAEAIAIVTATANINSSGSTGNNLVHDDTGGRSSTPSETATSINADNTRPEQNTDIDNRIATVGEETNGSTKVVQWWHKGSTMAVQW